MNKTVNIRTFPLQNYYVISIFSWQKTCYKTYFEFLHYNVLSVTLPRVAQCL